MAWKIAKMTMTKKCVLYGQDLFACDWESTGQTVQFKDPLHGQKTSYPVYEVLIQASPKRFAYKEVMPGKHIFLTEE